MPTIPDANEFSRGGVNPSARAASFRPGVVSSAKAQAASADAQTILSTTDAATRFIGAVGDLAYQEQLKIEKAQLEGAESRAVTKMTELSIGDKGFSKAKQGDVLAKGFTSTHNDAFDSEMAKIRNELPNDSARNAFDEKVKTQLKPAHARAIMNHVSNETDSYKETTAKLQIDSYTNLVKSNPFDASTRLTASESVRATAINRLMDQGITDRDALQAATDAIMGNFHSEVADSMREQGNPQAASLYLDERKDDMAPELYEKAKSQLADALAFAQGQESANAAFSVFQQAGSYIDAEKELNKITDPATRRAAEVTFNGMVVAQKRDNENRKGDIILKIADRGFSSESMSEAINSAEYRALPASEQVELRDYLYNRTNAELKKQDMLLARADAKERRKLADADAAQRRFENAPETILRTAEYMRDPDILAGMSDTEIMGKITAIGESNVKELLSARNTVRRIGASAKLDPALEKEALADIDKKDRPKVAAMIHMEFLRWHSEHPGSQPTPEEQKRIALAGQEDWRRTGFFGTKDIKAYEVEEGDAAFPAWMDNIFEDKTSKDKALLYKGVVNDVKFLAQQKRWNTALKAEGLKALTPDEAVQKYLQIKKDRGVIK